MEMRLGGSFLPRTLLPSTVLISTCHRWTSWTLYIAAILTTSPWAGFCVTPAILSRTFHRPQAEMRSEVQKHNASIFMSSTVHMRWVFCLVALCDRFIRKRENWLEIKRTSVQEDKSRSGLIIHDVLNLWRISSLRKRRTDQGSPLLCYILRHRQDNGFLTQNCDQFIRKIDWSVMICRRGQVYFLNKERTAHPWPFVTQSEFRLFGKQKCYIIHFLYPSF